MEFDDPLFLRLAIDIFVMPPSGHAPSGLFPGLLVSDRRNVNRIGQVELVMESGFLPQGHYVVYWFGERVTRSFLLTMS